MSEQKRKIVPLGRAEQLETNLLNNFNFLSRLNCITKEFENKIVVEIKIKDGE